MVLTDMFGWVKRNLSKMSDYDKRKMLKEINQMQVMLEKSLKMRGAS